jgi:hypothetical protein
VLNQLVKAERRPERRPEETREEVKPVATILNQNMKWTERGLECALLRFKVLAYPCLPFDALDDSRAILATI